MRRLPDRHARRSGTATDNLRMGPLRRGRFRGLGRGVGAALGGTEPPVGHPAASGGLGAFRHGGLGARNRPAVRLRGRAGRAGAFRGCRLESSRLSISFSSSRGTSRRSRSCSTALAVSAPATALSMGCWPRGTATQATSSATPRRLRMRGVRMNWLCDELAAFRRAVELPPVSGEAGRTGGVQGLLRHAAIMVSLLVGGVRRKTGS
jgi:hypothetical protein